ncbi:MAG: SMP-30/gluconolactonase/LRE family protein [Kribbellaceae bacterium]
MSEPEILLTGLVIGESARWHEGRLWFSNWGTHEVVATDLDGNREVMAEVPVTIPFSIDWLPDGRLLATAGPEGRLLRQEPDGTLVDHADLSGLEGGLNEIVVDGRGNIYVNGGNDFHPDEGVAPGFIALVTPDGAVRRVADQLAFPNGMAVTPDNSTLIIAESFAGTLTAFDIAADGSLSNRRVWAKHLADGISMDADGAVWTPTMIDGESACIRVREGGEVLDRVPLPLSGFACALGGEDGMTLFMLVADWQMAESFEDNLTRLTTGPRTGQVLTARAPVPHAGRP